MRASFRLLSKKWLWFFLIIGFLATVALVLYVWALTSVGSGIAGLFRETDMTPQIGWVLIIILAAGVLFTFDWVPADVTALGILVLLVLLGLLPDEEAFSGFGSETVLMIFGLFVLTAALLRTGVVDIARRKVLQYSSDNPNRLFNVIIWVSAILGAFISNTASTAFFLPIVMGAARRIGVAASKLLMPLAFASILTSSVTLVSTSTNIVISGLMTRNNLPPIGMFELAPVGIPIAVVGLLYMQTLGRRLIPNRAHSGDLTDSMGIRRYLTEILIPADSALVGKTLKESRLGQDLDLTVLRLIRGNNRYLIPMANRRLEANDVLLVEGERDEILGFADESGNNIKIEGQFSDDELKTEDLRMAEVILLPGSPLIRRTLRQHQFRQRYRLQVLAIYRHGKTIRKKIGRLKLRAGDILLLQGDPVNIAALEEDNTFNIIGPVEREPLKVSRAPVAIVTFVAVLAGATFNIVTLPVAVLIGALVVFVTGSISPDQAYRETNWRALILIGSMLGLGRAMEGTGTADYLATQIVEWAGSANPIWLLSGFFGLAVLLTQPMSNQAAAIVVVPVAIQTALQAGLNPRTFAMMIAVAASTSYLTPLEPACLLVYGPGGYRFYDFLKVGSLLTILIYIIAIILVPISWPLSYGG